MIACVALFFDGDFTLAKPFDTTRDAINAASFVNDVWRDDSHCVLAVVWAAEADEMIFRHQEPTGYNPTAESKAKAVEACKAIREAGK